MGSEGYNTYAKLGDSGNETPLTTRQSTLTEMDSKFIKRKTELDLAVSTKSGVPSRTDNDGDL